MTDDYLHDWDERFHALVAKNMISHPFQPMLRQFPILPNWDYTAWCCNHIWLHKQPLFLWQMALSMKIFGVNLIALRLPSALMGAALVFPTYRIACLLFNREVAYYSSFLIAFAYYQIEFVSGAMGMDHNDMAFLFYVTMSLWSFFEYINTLEHKKWLILIGIFAGAAILCKWLTGLLVYSGWSIFILSNFKNRKLLLLDFFKSLFICVVVFLPWQLYIHIYFPKESSFERVFNSKHIFEVIENHGGAWYFYIRNLNIHYGMGIIILLFIGVLLLFQSIKERNRHILSFFIAIIYLFFSFVVKTKMISYVYVVSPLMYILIALALDSIFKIFQTKIRSICISILLLLSAFFTLQPIELMNVHYKSSQIAIKRNNTNIFKALNTIVPSDYVIFNCKSFEDTEAMFFSDRNVYHRWMSEEEYKILKGEGKKIAIFKNHTTQEVPVYLANDKDILVIDKELK